MSFILSKINHLFNQIRGKVYNDLEKNLDVYVEIQDIKNSNYSNYNKKKPHSLGAMLRGK